MIGTGISITALVVLLSTSSIGNSHVEQLAQKEFSLQNRYKISSVNTIFSDNILLTLAYMRGAVKKDEPIHWGTIREPFEYAFILEPNKIFAFHDSVPESVISDVTQTTKAHFISTEGFKSDGWLVGDGVCHLASFMNVVAKNAGLKVDVPSNHNFAEIPDVPKSEGVSIYFDPMSKNTSALHNLYITNSYSKPVAFLFQYKNSELNISVTEMP